MTKKRIGIALGGGGVRGLAHIAVLETLDDLGVRPAAIAGCSMGAILGALYAAGRSGAEIRELVEHHTVTGDDTLRDVLRKGATLLRWVTGFAPERQRGGLVNADRFLGYLLGPLEDADFADLETRLVVVATDYWSAECVVLEEGAVLPAVRASMAVPGVFAPVTHEGRVLVDGGLVDPVPYGQLVGCDVIVAVDVGGERRPGRKETPSAVEAMVGALEIMQTAALNRRLERDRPDILVRPRIRDVEMLDFTRIDTVMRQSRNAIDELRAKLEKRLGD